MSRSTYKIRYEPHTSPAVTDYVGNRRPPMRFSYSIRRSDGSLVFRAANHEEARQLLDRLLEEAREPNRNAA